MANEKFGPHHPTIIEAKHVEALYELWGIDYAVEIEAAEDGETPETVRPGYCVAYTSHFQDGGLSFPLPRFLLEALAELGMAFAQMAPNFWRYFLASWIRARKEGLRFGLEELKQLFSIKKNIGFPRPMILASRPGRSIIDGIPNRDDRWREKFFVFKINSASVGDFDFETIPREWSNEIEPFGSTPMTPKLRGLIATLRRGNPRWLAFTAERIQATYALPPGENRATPVGPVVPVRPEKGHRAKRAREKEVLPDRPDESSEVGSLERAQKTRHGPRPLGRGHRRAPNASTGSVGDQALNDEIDSLTHWRRRRAHKGTNSMSLKSPSSGLPPPLRVLGGGTSQADPSARIPDVQETSSWRFSYDDEVTVLENPKGLALIWRKIRGKGCELPPLDDMRERDAYVQMAVANAKAMEASNEYAALMEKRLADFPSKEEVGGHLLTIQQLRGELEAVRVTEKHREVEIEGLKGNIGGRLSSLARPSLAQEYDAVLAVVKDKLRKKKEETAAEIYLQEVRARIEALTEYSEGGFELEEELVHLKDREISLNLDYGVASVSDPSLSRLDLPEVSGDSVDQE
ncbi:hypothetical protein DY000_02037505 [Brassica cretica]|uniref:Aminotransferase-like plant mobile domain-containing protein n=1 Tax=Brassica cretica TaxID=69181 RepID=A0ABQ7B4Z6_BRACR|nr:hypothetical protein DY000_02037505 [Brassica cretica]